MVNGVSEFVILAPGEAHDALMYSRERLRCYLAGMFPRYRFSLAQMAADAASDEFVIVPVVGSVGDEDHPGEMYGSAEEATLIEIRNALEAFEIYSGLVH